MEQTRSKRVNPWLLAIMKSTDAASALDVSPRDGWIHTNVHSDTHIPKHPS